MKRSESHLRRKSLDQNKECRVFAFSRFCLSAFSRLAFLCFRSIWRFRGFRRFRDFRRFRGFRCFRDFTFLHLKNDRCTKSFLQTSSRRFYFAVTLTLKTRSIRSHTTRHDDEGSDCNHTLLHTCTYTLSHTHTY